MKTTPLLVSALALVLVGCASPDKSARGVTDAATTPLSDLNLVRAPIPPVLVQAQKQPYVEPAESTCMALAADIHALDEVLGPDLDTPATAGNPGLIERGGDAVGNAAIGALRNTAEGVVPFRGWVRKLTGAERYSKEVAAAIAAGTARRAFLKGVRTTRQCTTAERPA